MMKKFKEKFVFLNLTFAELFSIIFVICSEISFYVADKFRYKVLNRYALSFYIFLIIALISINIFRFKTRMSIFVVLLVLFSFFYTLLNFVQKDQISNGTIKFTVRVTSDIRYKNNHSTFEGIVINQNNKKYGIAPGSKVIVHTDKIYPALIRGSNIEGKGRFTLVDRKKSDYNFYLFSKSIDYYVEATDIKITGFSKPEIFYGTVFKLKRYIENVCERILPYPHSTFATALLTGNRHQIPLYITEIFKTVGTLHILAISGLHMGFIAGIFIVIFALIGFRHIALYLIVSIFVALYALFIGDSPSVKRASIMFVFGVFLYAFDRDRDYVNLISVVFLVFMLLNPRSIHNPGVLLSFLATFGIVYFASFIEKSLKKYLPKMLSILVSMSLAASVYNFPVMMDYFGNFSYISIIANIPIIPLTALILILSILMMAFYPFFLPLSILIGNLNSFFISLLFLLNVIFSYVPPVSFNLKTSDNLLIYIYFGIVTLSIYYFIKRKQKLVEMI